MTLARQSNRYALGRIRKHLGEGKHARSRMILANQVEAANEGNMPRYKTATFIFSSRSNGCYSVKCTARYLP